MRRSRSRRCWGAEVSAVMVRIQQRQAAEQTGLDDAQAYGELPALLTHGLTT
ncbi:hypothetical protein ACFWCF_13770 [Rhodococcus sp. NPDC060090]|uniref:hypothetical protein n=1 Tax=Rhodococcus sp. NPDC060090 TaxID=3347056 RepID=UPI00365AE555